MECYHLVCQNFPKTKMKFGQKSHENSRNFHKKAPKFWPEVSFLSLRDSDMPGYNHVTWRSILGQSTRCCADYAKRSSRHHHVKVILSTLYKGHIAKIIWRPRSFLLFKIGVRSLVDQCLQKKTDRQQDSSQGQCSSRGANG